MSDMTDTERRWIATLADVEPAPRRGDPTVSEPLTPTEGYGPCPTRLDNQATSSIRPWSYGHAASVEGAHWNIYAGEGIDGWLVGLVTSEADAALIVEAVNDAERSRQPVPDLRAALEANYAQLEREHGHSSAWPDDTWPSCRVVHDALRAARAALAVSSGPSEEP